MLGCPGGGGVVERGGGFVAASGDYEVSADFVAASGDYEVSADFVAAGVERGGFLGGCCAPSVAET